MGLLEICATSSYVIYVRVSGLEESWYSLKEGFQQYEETLVNWGFYRVIISSLMFIIFLLVISLTL